MNLTPKERLLRVLHKEEVDRPPVICTGGMMNAAIVEIMEKTGHTLPEAHFDAARMAELARDIHDHTGFENIGVPFCMTIEAEMLGSEIDHGTLACEPKIVREVFPGVRDVEFRDIEEMVHSGRIQVVVEAAHQIAKQNPDVPVIASLTPGQYSGLHRPPFDLLQGTAQESSGSASRARLRYPTARRIR